MHDSELKKILLETHPVLPGQEARAWDRLRERLSPAPSPDWISVLMGWRGAVVGCSLIVAAVMALNFVSLRSYPASFASVASQSPGIYATAFYSHSAHAQVVWLNGLEPASDRLTYMDPTTVVATTPPAKTGSTPNGP